MYERDTNTDTRMEVAKRTAGDGAGQDDFGGAVSIAGDYAIVGSQKTMIGIQFRFGLYLHAIRRCWTEKPNLLRVTARKRMTLDSKSQSLMITPLWKRPSTVSSDLMQVRLIFLKEMQQTGQNKPS